MMTALRGKSGRALFLALMLIVVAACGPDQALPGTSTTGSQPAATTTTVSSSPSEIVIVTAEDPPTLESAYGYSATTGLVLRNIQEPLVGRDRETGEFVGLLATSWELVDDTTWRFYIREGVTFHDGSPLNAESAAFGVNLNWDDSLGAVVLGLKGPQFEAVVVDEYVMDVVLESPDPLLPQRLWATPLPSMEHFEEKGLEGWRSEPIGTGPYRFVEWDRGNSIVIERNEDWWGNDSPDADGAATIDRATYLIRTDQASRAAALSAGEADLAPRLPADLCLNSTGGNCLLAPDINIIHVRFDHMNPVFGDIRVREAINLGIDREAIGEAIVPGDPAPMLCVPACVGFNDDLEPSPYDPDRARELIEEARADGVPVDQTLNLRVERAKFPGVEEAAEAFQAMMQDIGLTVDFQVLEPGVFLEQAVNPERPISPDRAWMILHQANSPLGDFSVVYGSWMRCEGPVSTYCNEESDELYTAALPATGDERDRLMAEAARLVAEDFAFAPIVYMSLFHGVPDHVEWDLRADTHVYLKNIRLTGD